MTTDLPLVSICMPTYNGARYLEEALRSAFAQTYPALELVVSDDGSTDETLAIVERLCTEAPMPLRVVKHRPAGIGANWNHCVAQAKGVYIKFLFQDDLLAPDCVARMVDMALRDPAVGLVYCRRHVLHDPTDAEHERWVRTYGALHIAWSSIRVEEGIMPGRLLLGDPALMEKPENKVGEPTAVLLHRRVFAREGGFDEDLKQVLDYVYWYKVFRHFKVAFVDAELVTFRLHVEQASQVNARADLRAEFERMPRYFLRHFWPYLHRRALVRLVLRHTALGRKAARLVHRIRTLKRS